MNRVIDPQRFRTAIVAPALDALMLWSQAAENLVCGTALQESGLRTVVQDGGPALSAFQIELATHDDLHANFLKFRPDLAVRLDGLTLGLHPEDELLGNWFYAAAIGRLIYERAAQPLPAADDLPGLGAYWKAHYNTPLGAGTAEEWVANYRAAYPSSTGATS